VDIGLGFDADFSQAMLKRFPVQSYGFDPTRKHAPALASIAAASSGRFKFVPAAVSTESGTLQFHESANNVSGSLLAAHPNVRGQQHETYSVSAMTLDEILDQVPAERIALAKLDVEGIEYDVLKSVSDATLLRVPQWVIEFHHGVVQPFRFADTRRHVRRFERLGYRTYSRDGINFLWFKG
jgi:FkbM family methyltransferase